MRYYHFCYVIMLLHYYIMCYCLIFKEVLRRLNRIITIFSKRIAETSLTTTNMLLMPASVYLREEPSI